MSDKIQKAFELLYTLGYLTLLRVIVPVWVAICIIVGLCAWPVAEFIRFSAMKSIGVAVWFAAIPAKIKAKAASIKQAVTPAARPEPAPEVTS